ncbi:phosphatidylethanolamine-binding protein [Absidia repens]|uniref:Phosphatidylethanolamine-binding protein n=1 Tax=Absidia repens TaxID=90262 RepID=A0A1X2III6_9FUNG|nr:phosphatidylethanolamine-binding protein [Absidia repens]
MFRLVKTRLSNTITRSCNIKVRWASTNKATNTAYEEALKLIQTDKAERLEILSTVEKELARVAKEASPTQKAQLAALNTLKYDLQVKSELNDPQVRSNFDNNTNVDMSRPVYRYLAQRQFEKQPRSKLLERITQMNVVPDVVDVDINPTVEIKIELPNEELSSLVEPGVIINPEQTVTCPNVQVSNFHTDTRLYTMMLVDPDSPDVANQTYQQYCHWLITNVPLSATEPTVQGGDAILNYIPPHPQKGTKTHRYTWIAYEQGSAGQDQLNIITKMDQRHGFDAKAFAKEHGLTVRGITFFRQKWNESVSKIYSDILETKEPVYGKPPKPERYIQRTMYI